MRQQPKTTSEWCLRLSSNSRNGRQGEKDAERDIIIGKIVSVNVPRRTVRISPETSYPERFHELRELRLRTKQGGRLRLALEGVRITQSVVIAEVAVDSDETIASARGAVVVVPLSERFRLPENEYYEDDLIGLVVRDAEGSVIGRLREIWDTPANDIYQVLDDEGREILLPAVDEVILKVDIEAGEMVADISNLI